ncbi:MAG: AAC(3) family N-acetyltransferase [bacterium]|nr:AAC(3) family N-acetyltransferase [bacterium]
MSDATEPTGYTKEILKEHLSALGIRKGNILLVKASLKSVGKVVGGAQALVDAFVETVGEEGTVISASFVSGYPLPFSEEDAKKVVTVETPSYAGAFTNTMVKDPRMYRSRHPLQKFVAIGKDAKELMERHTAQTGAYEVVNWMIEKGGLNVKVGDDDKVPGIGTTHVAILQLGLKQKTEDYGVNYLDADGQVKFFQRNWAGGCARGFINFIPLYEKEGAILATGHVGNAAAKMTDLKKTLEIELRVLRENPSFFLCDDPLCSSCRTSWEFLKKTPSYYLMKTFAPLVRGTKISASIKSLRKRLAR